MESPADAGASACDRPAHARYARRPKGATDAALQDEVIALPETQRGAAPGCYPRAYQPSAYHPSAYHIACDAQAKEYRSALTQLTRRD